jgi:uncharacterized membrane protein
MDLILDIVRFIHILGGIVWAGGTITFSNAVAPTARKLGPDAAKFMQHLSTKSAFTPMMGALAITTTLTGLYMYGELFGAGIPLNSRAGLWLTIGGLAGVGAFLLGFLVLFRNTRKLRGILEAIEAQGGPPNESQMAEMQALAESSGKNGAIMAVLFTIAMAGMSIGGTSFF